MTIESAPILHGPIKSPRLGKVVAIDLTAPQSNLVTERGSVLPRASLVVTTAARFLIEHSKAGEKIENLVLMGSTVDPSAHPAIREIAENLRALRDKWFSRAKLCLFTQCRDLTSPEVRIALGYFDKLFLSYEWGTAKTFTRMTGEKSTLLATLTHQLASFDQLFVQASFYRGDVDNSTDTEVKAWIKKLQEVRPREVQILDGVRQVEGMKLKAITKTRQQQILDAVAECGLTVTTHKEEPLTGLLQQSA
jgi:hypothetical protein